jgi:hypothetical protein
MRRVSFYTEKNNVFYLELAIDRTEFIRLHEFDAMEAPDPDELMDMDHSSPSSDSSSAASQEDNDELLKSLGM